MRQEDEQEREPGTAAEHPQDAGGHLGRHPTRRDTDEDTAEEEREPSEDFPEVPGRDVGLGHTTDVNAPPNTTGHTPDVPEPPD